MSITTIDNQAVKLYDITEALFNDGTNGCQWHHDYFQKITCDDTTEIVVNTGVQTPNVEKDGDMVFNVTGTNTAVNPGRLADFGVDFSALGVLVGMTVRNTTNDTTAQVTAVGTTTLDLDTDIFTATPEDYSISWYKLSGNMTFGTAEIVKTSGAVGEFSQVDILTLNNAYKMEIDITSFSSSSPGDQINIKIGGTIVATLDETDNPTGTITVYGIASGVTPLDVTVTVDSNIDATFSTLRVSQISNIVFFVMECDTDTIVYSSVLGDVSNSITQDQIKLSFDWGNLMDGYSCNSGCYYIGGIQEVGIPVNLSEDRISNGGFDSGTDWTTGDWTIGSGMASIFGTFGSPAPLKQTSLAYDFSAGLSYTVSGDVPVYEIGRFNVDLYLNGVFVLYLGTVNGGGAFKSASTGILTSNADEIRFTHFVGETISLSIDNVTAVLDLDFNADGLRTDCFQLADSHECTVKLSGTNLDNAFGIDFEGLNYTPTIRVDGELTPARYGGDKENEEDSSSVSKTLYFKSEKKRDLFLYQQPEHIHDFIRLLIGYDDFQIDDVAYLVDSPEYEPEVERVSGKMPDTSNVTIEVRKKTDLNKNRFC